MSHSIEKSTELTKITYWGTLTNDDIEGVVKNAVDNLELSNRIEDMRNLHDVSIGFKELLSFTQILEKMEIPQTVKSAILTGSPLQYGIARMFQTILSHSQMKIQVFTDEEKARSWLSSSD
jgi:hypothetical protein